LRYSAIDLLGDISKDSPTHIHPDS
jgi:hypothetical protein